MITGISVLLDVAFSPLMSELLNVVSGQSCYTDYVTVLTFRHPSFLVVTKMGYLRIFIRIIYLIKFRIFSHTAYSYR
jgi:hypothetical protein